MSNKENTVFILFALVMIAYLAFQVGSLSMRVIILETAAHDHGWTLVKP